MSARSQGTCYPSAGLVTQNGARSPVCTVCNADSGHVQPDCNDSNNSTACGSCVACNTICVQIQAYCNINHENINNHADVGKYNATCEVKDEFIFRNWRSAWWNDLQDDLLTADIVGKTKNQGAGFSMTPTAPDPENAPHPLNSLVTAAKYNEIVAGINAFNTSINSVKTGDVIRAAHAIAFHTGFDAAKFDTDVCDVCNAAVESHFNCTCNCTCSCSCSCTCSCGCGCSCSCSCGCSCSCTKG